MNTAHPRGAVLDVEQAPAVRPRELELLGVRHLDTHPRFRALPEAQRFALKVVSQVLPFRVNSYVVDELIDWDRVPDDPMYQLTMAQRGMLRDDHFDTIASLLRRGAPAHEVRRAADEIRAQLNPNPAGQMTANVPLMDEARVPGVQHKYRDTCLVFPSQGQTCHAYCTYCFRWSQFVGSPDLRFATDESRRFQQYLRRHPEVSDVLFTGGDPMVMSAARLASYVLPLLQPEFEHVRTIRIGTKSLAYWPHRFVTDADADEVLRLFETVVAAGKHLAVMAHYSHWVEMGPEVARQAVRRVRATGAEIRTQAPVVRHVNDRADVWVRLWNEQVGMGCIPYYMFVERNTGAQIYFDVPLERVWTIFRDAYNAVPGLCRTVRGPTMSADPGKVAIHGIMEVGGERVFVLSMLRARNPDWATRPFLAAYDPRATWFTDLKPAFGASRFFFEDPGGAGHAPA